MVDAEQKAAIDCHIFDDVTKGLRLIMDAKTDTNTDRIKECMNGLIHVVYELIRNEYQLGQILLLPSSYTVIRDYIKAGL